MTKTKQTTTGTLIQTFDTDARMRPVDLHVHSCRSDGTFTPSELVDYAIEKGLAAFALTDHDTVDGLEEAISYAESLRATLPAEKAAQVPEIIPGIEFSTEYQGKDVHIVGLFIDYQKPSFQARLQAFVNARIERNRKMCRMMQEGEGFDISYEALMEEFPNAVITRAHYASYLLKHGYTKSLKEAFDRYIGDFCPYFVPREKVTPTQAVEMVLDAGGVPILAHPCLYQMSDARLEELILTLKASGLVGLEAVYSTYKLYEERRMRELAKKHDLLISGGSDFHGKNKPDIDLGVGYGKLFLPHEVLTTLREAK